MSVNLIDHRLKEWPGYAYNSSISKDDYFSLPL